MRIAIFHDRVPPDAGLADQDTLVQAAAVRQALESLGHEVRQLELPDSRDAIQDLLSDLAPDLAFNLVESSQGSGHTIHALPSLLEQLGLPFTGAGSKAMLCTANKLLCKAMLRAAHIPTPLWISAWQLLDPGARDIPALSGQWLLKSVWEHASFGMDNGCVLQSPSRQTLAQALVERMRNLGGDWFAEGFVHGREFNLALLEMNGQPVALPPAEITFHDFDSGRPRIVGHAAKWDESAFEYAHTLRTFDFPAQDAPLLKELKSLALACWQAFDLKGYARVDFRVSEYGRPFVIDINANPCLSPDAGFAATLDRASIPFASAVDAIAKAALKIAPQQPLQSAPRLAASA